MEQLKIGKGNPEDYRASLTEGNILPGDFVFVPGSPSLVFEVMPDGNLIGLTTPRSPEVAIGENRDWVVYRW